MSSKTLRDLIREARKHLVSSEDDDEDLDLWHPNDQTKKPVAKPAACPTGQVRISGVCTALRGARRF